MLRAEDNAGGRISQWISPGFTIRAAGDTTVSLTWYPHAEIMTLAGLRTYELFVLAISSTPFAWMPQATLSVVGGEMVDNVTGAVGDGCNIAGTMPLRFSQLEIASTVGYQTSQSASADGANGRCSPSANCR